MSSSRRYHDFVILVEVPDEAVGGGLEQFTVRVFQSPVGEGEKRETVTIPDPNHGIPDYDQLIRQRRRLADRRLDLGEQIAYGQVLTRLLLPPYARQLLDRSLSALGPGEGLRVRLRMPRRLAHLPWEYMHLGKPDEAPAPTGFMALDARISIVRHEAIHSPPEEIRAGRARRVLIAMATPKPYQKYNPLKSLPEEQQEIRAALEKVQGLELVRCLPEYENPDQWETLTGARRDQVQSNVEELKPVHIFHFSGHGEFPTEMGAVVGEHQGEGHLVLADGNNQAVPISGDDLQALLGEHGIQLVTLGACETGTRDIFNAWSSVAVALLRGRIPSVVAMQFRIWDDLAASFMEEVYRGLVAGRTIDEAVAAGRAAIHGLSYGERAGARDWGTPVLYSRVPGGCIFPPVEDEDARRDAEQKLDAISSLHQAWWDWTDHRATASISQLRYLDGLGEDLQTQPAQALLLLRSAVQVNEPVETWLAHLRRTGAELIVVLDDPATASTTREEASVFQLEDVPKQGRPQDVGAVAWAAASHPDPAPRHTAAMALTALPEDPDAGPERVDAGLARIDGALAGIKWPWKRYARKAELRGALADGDPQIEQANGGLPPWDRLGIWFWRFGRRVVGDWERIVLLMLGGGLGAGLGLGPLRALVAFLTWGKRNPGTYLQIYGYSGVFLGAMLCLGMLLAGPAMLEPVRRWGRNRERPDLRVQLAAVLLGALFFGLGHALLFGLRGEPIAESPLVYLFGFVMGLGLTLALYGQPRTGHKLGIGSALLRVTLAAAVSAGIQAVFIWVPDTGGALDIALSRNFYASNFPDRVSETWLTWLALIDAALAGVVLTIGLNIGLAQASRLAEWLRGLREGAGE